MMRVMLVNPPYHFWEPNKQYLERVLGHSPPLGLLSVASYAQAHCPGLDIELLDAPALCLSPAATIEHIVARKPDVVGIGVVTSALPSARRIAAGIKQHLPHTTVVTGGPHMGCRAEEALRQEPSFDYAVVGEGEQTFAELLDAIAAQRSVAEISGLVHRNATGAIQRNCPRALIENLDSLPLPAWDMLPGFPRRYPSNIFFSPSSRAASLCTSRGCVYRCRFCDQSTFGRSYRTLSPDTVVSAVEELIDRHGIRYIIFCDDNFTAHNDRVFAICDRLRTLKRPIAWSCDGNVMTVTRPLLKAMKAAGCWGISYGIESGAPEVLDSLDKRIDLARARDVTIAAREEGIHVKGLFILGTPEESPATIAATRRFLLETPFTTINLSKFTPYPGSELHDEVAADHEFDYAQLNGMNFVVPSKRLSIAALEREYAETIRWFFGQPKVRREYLRLLGRWDSIKRLTGMAPWALRAWLFPERTVSQEHA
ncbi:MAG TPA: radical SAM protein [Candidatus Hydrogenedentes bacterium]|nr:radical SAM protein [Candidatus Hydrogenedentota bacterium]HOS03144.1 radical SAM protein [Candidatus Hydrogenedentota bacterium]